MCVDEMRNVYMGQSFDLYWTYNVECPTVEEYLKMIDNSTCSPPITPSRNKILISDRNGWDLPLALEAHAGSLDGKPCSGFRRPTDPLRPIFPDSR